MIGDHAIRANKIIPVYMARMIKKDTGLLLLTEEQTITFAQLHTLVTEFGAEDIEVTSESEGTLELVLLNCIRL